MHIGPALPKMRKSLKPLDRKHVPHVGTDGI